MERRHAAVDETRRRIVAAAIRLHSRQGTAATRWDEIADAAGVSRATMYHHFPSLDALRAGYAIYPVVDAVARTSSEAHRAGLERVVQAGGQPISWVSLACELQRD